MVGIPFIYHKTLAQKFCQKKVSGIIEIIKKPKTLDVFGVSTCVDRSPFLEETINYRPPIFNKHHKIICFCKNTVFTGHQNTKVFQQHSQKVGDGAGGRGTQCFVSDRRAM